MAITPSALKADILARPELSGYVRVGDDVSIVNFYNTPQPGINSSVITLTNDQILRWSATGPYSKMYDVAYNSGNLVSHAVRSRCFTILRLVDSFNSVDVSSNTISGVMVNLATNGVISAVERDNFLNLSTKGSSTPSEALFGGGTIIGLSNVSMALRGSA